MCPTCHAVEYDIVDLAGTGVIYSYSILHHPQNPAFDYPVVAVLVDLDEGIRIVSNLIGIEPSEVSIGLPVRVRFVPTRDEMAVPVFTPLAVAQ